MTSKKFDYIAILHLSKETIEFFNQAASLPFETNEPIPYEVWRDYIRKADISVEERSLYTAGTERSKIEKELLAHGDYSFTYHERVKGKDARRQLQYSWLNKEEGDVLLLRSDVTRAYEEEQQRLRILQDAVKVAEEANDSKSEFLSRISHDIRTPISIITSMTNFALEDIQDQAKVKDDLRKIQASNTFLLSLINDVLDISKIDSGKMELHPEPYLYADYLSNVENMAVPLCQAKGLHFVIHERPAAGSIQVDHIRFNQITLNLLSNAVKYTAPGGTVSFTCGSEKIPDKGGYYMVYLDVEDTGIGMSADFQKKMFQPFTQEYNNPSRPKASTGTGLGLAIVKRIVDLMGGTIEVHSALGKGTRMSVRFPALPSEKTDLEESVKKSPVKTAPFVGKVLLCEDNDINTAIAKRILSSLGARVDCAKNGEEGLNLFKASAPGDYFAILMDIQMPILNGYETTEKIRSLDRPDAKKIPIIAMTADAFTAAMEKCKEVGMDDYLTKPLDPSKIQSVLLKAQKK